MFSGDSGATSGQSAESKQQTTAAAAAFGLDKLLSGSDSCKLQGPKSKRSKQQTTDRDRSSSCVTFGLDKFLSGST